MAQLPLQNRILQNLKNPTEIMREIMRKFKPIDISFMKHVILDNPMGQSEITKLLQFQSRWFPKESLCTFKSGKKLLDAVDELQLSVDYELRNISFEEISISLPPEFKLLAKRYYQTMDSNVYIRHIGVELESPDGRIRWYFPVLMHVNGDYPELCMLSLTVAGKSAPMTCCFVPEDHLCDCGDPCGKFYDLKTTKKMKELIQQGIKTFKNGVTLHSRLTRDDYQAIMKSLLLCTVDLLDEQQLECFKTFNDLVMTISSTAFTDTDLDAMQQKFVQFEQQIKCFLANSKSKLCFPKLHTFGQFAHLIRKLGAPDGYGTEAVEASHVNDVVKAYLASNRKNAEEQSSDLQYSGIKAKISKHLELATNKIMMKMEFQRYNICGLALPISTVACMIPGDQLPRGPIVSFCAWDQSLGSPLEFLGSTPSFAFCAWDQSLGSPLESLGSTPSFALCAWDQSLESQLLAEIPQFHIVPG
ncbi:hypothetical protein BDR26DRAFT_1008583 [Obelidium mucronatum]|nr:hypothetical protein BDR26DRAFT_1008583 [Obelidium mucronatum]